MLCSVMTGSGGPWLRAGITLCRTAAGEEQRHQGVTQCHFLHASTAETMHLGFAAFLSGEWSWKKHTCVKTPSKEGIFLVCLTL